MDWTYNLVIAATYTSAWMLAAIVEKTEPTNNDKKRI